MSLLLVKKKYIKNVIGKNKNKNSYELNNIFLLFEY